ncbi:MAG TPA: hypothetical protein VFV23_07515, partial [Verrucomicrobiae bacterium]|nr:hypothetical protein [Verrucomicrobiae bacterium]
TAVLDASTMGYASNQYDSDGVTLTNQILITNSTLEIVSGQTLAGIGTIRGKLVADAGSIMNPGNPTGSSANPVTGILTVTNDAELAGAVFMSLDSTNPVTSDELVAASFTIDGTATLTVTNVGPNIINGTTFQLFNHAVNFTGGVTLPATDPSGTSTYVWTDNLNADGSIQLVSGGANPVNETPTNIVVSVSGGNINLSWPDDHIGWRLQVQTNSLATGLSTNDADWFDVSGSTSVNSESIPINTNTNGAVFYRMVYP